MGKKFLVVAVMALTFGMVASASADLIFFDDFNRGHGATVGNGWTEVEVDSFDVSLTNSGMLQLRDYQSGWDAAVLQAITTAGFGNVSLSFDWASNSGTSDGNTLKVMASNDGGTIWTEKWSASTYPSMSLTSVTLDLSGYDNLANFSLAFRTSAHLNHGGEAYVDNVSLTGAPVPEPATMLLFGTGLVGLVGISMRRKKK